MQIQTGLDHDVRCYDGSVNKNNCVVCVSVYMSVCIVSGGLNLKYFRYQHSINAQSNVISIFSYIKDHGQSKRENNETRMMRWG
jgi:hypothetical protein